MICSIQTDKFYFSKIWLLADQTGKTIDSSAAAKTEKKIDIKQSYEKLLRKEVNPKVIIIAP